MTDAALATSNALYATMYRHGRADYRAGRPYMATASEAWRAGWIDEAHLLARAGAAPQMAIVHVRALDALEDAARVLRSGITTKPSKAVAQMIDCAKLSVPDALRRLRAAHDPTDHDDGADDRIPA